MKKLLSLVFLIFVSHAIWAQHGNTGMRFSKYGGSMSTYENPAFGAANNTKWELQLFSVNEMMENSLFKLDWQSVLDDGSFDLGGASDPNATDFSFRNVFEVYGPGVFFSLNKKVAIGLNTRARFFFQMQDANIDIANAAFADDNFNLNDFGPLREDFVNLNMNLMTDIGLTASAQILSLKKHKLYAGASLRFYRGVASVDFTGRTIDIDPDKIVNADSVVEFSADLAVRSAMPTDFDLLSGGTSLGANTLLSNAFNTSAGTGIGGDVGAVYHGQVFGKNVRASLSVTDIGSIQYNKGRRRSADFVANNVQIHIDSFDNFPSGYDSIKQWAANYGVTIDTGNVAYEQALPTRLNLYGELQLLKGFHIGFANSINLANTSKIHSSYSGYTAVIPRFQSRVLEAWVPLSYNYFSKNMKAGLGFRLAYFYFGSDDMLALVKSEAKSVNFYMGLRISGNYNKRKVKKAEEK